MFCFRILRFFWRKKSQKSKQEILGIRSSTPQRGMPHCDEAEGAKMAPLGYATA